MKCIRTLFFVIKLFFKSHGKKKRNRGEKIQKKITILFSIMSLLDKLFGAPKLSPEEQAKQWKKNLQAESRRLDNTIRKVQREEAKIMREAKKAVKSGDMGSAKLLAREILQSRKAVSRMYTGKTQINSVSMQLQNQVSQLKVTGTLQRSTEIMAGMLQLAKIGEVRETMMTISKEMCKAGILEETMNDALDDALGDGIEEEDLDEEVAKMVDTVIVEATKGTAVSRTALKKPARQQIAAEESEEEEDAEDVQE